MIDAAHADLHPCTGCVRCGYEGPCVQKDDMEQFRKEILGADMMVFVTPLYYYGMSAQLKILIDRFCAINSSITRKHMKSALLSAAWNADGWTFDALEAHYKTLVRYLDLDDVLLPDNMRSVSPLLSGNRLHAATVGVNYAFNKYVKLLLSYTYSHLDTDDFNTLQARLMFQF